MGGVLVRHRPGSFEPIDETAAIVFVSTGTAGTAAVLRTAVERLGLTAPRLLRRTPAGRPYLAHPGGDSWEVDFNVSHSGDLVAIAMGAAGRLGLDVQEPPRPGWERIARRWLHTEEWARIGSLPSDEGRAGFTRAWAIREARCKATGQGLAGFRSPTAIPQTTAGTLDGVHWRELPMPGGYAGAVACQGPSDWLTRPVVISWETPWKN